MKKSFTMKHSAHIHVFAAFISSFVSVQSMNLNTDKSFETRRASMLRGKADFSAPVLDEATWQNIAELKNLVNGADTHYADTKTTKQNIKGAPINDVTTAGACDFFGDDPEFAQLKHSHKHAPPHVGSFAATRKSVTSQEGYRKAQAFEARNECQDEPTIAAAFAELDKISGGKITPEQVEKNFQDDLLRLRFTIQGGEVSHDVRMEGGDHLSTAEFIKVRAPAYQDLISELLQEVELPDMQFALSLSDWTTGDAFALKTEGVPGKDLLVLPRSLADLGEQAHDMVSHAIEYPCSSYRDKVEPKKQAVFRGATTGVCLDPDACDTKSANFLKWNPYDPTLSLRPLPRYQLAALSRDRPDLLDAGFVSVVQAVTPKDQVKLTAALKNEGLMRSYLTDDVQRCYLAVVVMDGNSLPDRLARQLAYGTPVVFVDHNRTDEFWYDELRAGTDYIPATMSTLTAVIEKLQARPDLAKCIGENGQRFVSEHLSKNRLKCYMYKMLSEYGKRFKHA